MTAQTFSISAQISEVKREIAKRNETYPRWVRTGKLRQSEADYHLAAMEAVLRTLEWNRDNRDKVIAWIRDGKAA